MFYKKFSVINSAVNTSSHSNDEPQNVVASTSGHSVANSPPHPRNETENIVATTTCQPVADLPTHSQNESQDNVDRKKHNIGISKVNEVYVKPSQRHVFPENQCILEYSGGSGSRVGCGTSEHQKKHRSSFACSHLCGLRKAICFKKACNCYHDHHKDLQKDAHLPVFGTQRRCVLCQNWTSIVCNKCGKNYCFSIDKQRKCFFAKFD